MIILGGGFGFILLIFSALIGGGLYGVIAEHTSRADEKYKRYRIWTYILGIILAILVLTDIIPVLPLSIKEDVIHSIYNYSQQLSFSNLEPLARIFPNIIALIIISFFVLMITSGLSTIILGLILGRNKKENNML